MYSDSQMFFRQWLRKPLRIGAVAPSSRELADAMARLVPNPPDGPVVELGGGTGPITAALLEVGIPPGQLYVIEREPQLHRHLQLRFPGVHVTNVDRHFENAKRSGATIVEPVSNKPFGERQYTAEDPEGHRWTFSEHVADVPPHQWGAVLASS